MPPQRIVRVDAHRTDPRAFGRFASELAFGPHGVTSSMSFADPDLVAVITNGMPATSLSRADTRRLRASAACAYRDLGLAPAEAGGSDASPGE